MKKIVMSALLLACLNPFSAMASNAWFLDNTAVGNFTDADTTMFTDAVNKALVSYPDGKKLQWSNPNTGAAGYVIPMHAAPTNGMKCRQLQIYNEAKGENGKSSYIFCKVQGEWKILR